MPISNKLAIRLALHGCANRPFYHVVVAKQHRGRDTPPIEQLGTYEPMKNENNEVLIALNFDRIQFWMAKGARPSQPVAKLLGLSGFLPIHPMTYITAQRNRNAAVAGMTEVTDSAAETTQNQAM